MNSDLSQLIGVKVYEQNGSSVTTRTLARIIVGEGKILPWAVDTRGNGVHLGAVNSEGAAVRLIRSKMRKPDQSKTQVTLRFT